MPASSVTGAIYGDEGKGKVVDVISNEADLIVRYNGGNNAGHTIYIDDKKFVTHILPSGVLQGKKCAIAAGAVVDPRQLVKELDEFKDFNPNLIIDPRTHIIMPYHNILDGAREEGMEKHSGKKIGTTGMGIGPVHEDRSSRLGIRFFDLIDKKRLEEKLDAVYSEKAFLLKEYYKREVPVKEIILDYYTELGKELKKYVGDVSQEVIRALKENKKVLFEGAQGTLLDIFYGNYPRVTSSQPITGSIYANVGLPPIPIYNIGIVKAYFTKVGSGPMVTCLDRGNWPVIEAESDPMAIHIRKKGDEVGATTGRKRRVGWMDLVALAYSCELNGFDEIALTKLDVLAGIHPLKVAHNYIDENGNLVEKFKAWDLEFLNKCRPEYYNLAGFKSVVDEKGNLTPGAQSYIDMIEYATSIPVNFISTGKERSEYISRKKLWWSK